ncbi:type IV secretory system conjugative DNA transfer family protein (plasmid) [Nocardiopsis flavescens]|nr:type IV secretory system conjugative DNA transfer family protein [Nocardiopsis flavescens]
MRNDRRQVGFFAGDPMMVTAAGGLILVFALLGLVWLGGTAGAWASGAGWHPPRFGPAMIFAALRGQSLWPGVATPWIVGGIAGVGGAVVAATTTAAVLLLGRFRASVPGLATLNDIRDFTHGPRLAQARRLVPALKDTPAKQIDPADTGVVLGHLEGTRQMLRASLEDVTLVIAGPRSGKTSRIVIPQALEATGFCLITSVRADAYLITQRARERAGTTTLIDPQNVTHRPQSSYWDLVDWAGRSLDNARKAAENLSEAVEDPDKKGGDAYFTASGQATLANLLLAAGKGDRTLEDVLAWSTDPMDPTPAQLLADSGLHALAGALKETMELPDETRRGIYGHVQQALMPLYDPDIARWVTPQEGIHPFIPEHHVGARDTLYLLSKEGGGGAAGIIACLTDACIDACVALAEASPAERMPTPARLILDEAANVCRIKRLPKLYSHFGGRGILVTTILQSYEQGVTTWGKSGMGSLWGAATIKLLGAGLDDYSFLDQISHLVGLRAIAEESLSISRQGTSTTRSRRRERIIDAAELRELERSTALMLATSTRPALIRMPAWFEGPDSERIQSDYAHMSEQTRTLAAAKLTGDAS